jgi:hypothetical protein
MSAFSIESGTDTWESGTRTCCGEVFSVKKVTTADYIETGGSEVRPVGFSLTTVGGDGETDAGSGESDAGFLETDAGFVEAGADGSEADH